MYLKYRNSSGVQTPVLNIAQIPTIPVLEAGRSDLVERQPSFEQRQRVRVERERRELPVA
nr:MAG TPA: hypothetical protein [Caudoviricetes sp.]